MKTVERNALGPRLKQHFIEVLSITISPQPWPGESALPAFLRDLYAFLAARILGAPCLFMIDRGVRPNTPAAIRKHLFEVGRRWDGEVVYVAAGIDSVRRRRLIDQKIPFVVPGNQIYLPMLGVDLREHFRSARGAPEFFSPATQAVLLHALHRAGEVTFSPQEMAAALGYTRMTLSRAFNELEGAGIGRHFVRGKRRLMELTGPRRGLWEHARPLLRSPVVRRAHVRQPRRGVVGPAAGGSALAAYTGLAEPRSPVVAVASTAWASCRGRLSLAEADSADPGALEVKLWNYPPKAIAGGRVVDRLSLYLSVVGAADERVETALDEFLEGMEW